ncbi:MAG: IS110 family transposase, partial [Pseudomonadota bacterium]|nr:IS110 family transposase [Pseudomonadota bacterium]
ELSITRSGDVLLRKLLVQCAQYILGPHGPECDLRRVGRKLAARGGKAAKRKAVVAVARRLAVMLHRIWVTGVAYDPNYVDRPGRTTPGTSTAA